jgi:hypothetical protein
MKYLWLAVTADKYELPIIVEESAKQLADKLGITSSTVIASVSRNNTGKNAGRKIVKVNIDDD